METVKFLHKLESFSHSHQDFGFNVLVNIDKKPPIKISNDFNVNLFVSVAPPLHPRVYSESHGLSQSLHCLALHYSKVIFSSEATLQFNFVCTLGML